LEVGFGFDLTPLVEAASIDEAYMDFHGMALLHKAPAAAVLSGLQQRVESELSLTISVGLSYCKFLAKLASDLDKLRGFAIIGRAEAVEFLAAKPVRYLPGVGPAMEASLAAEGARMIGDLRTIGQEHLLARFHDYGQTLWMRAHGEDNRRVDPDGERKFVSTETTFGEDISDPKQLEDYLWTLQHQSAAANGVCDR
jgi:DNA polymerase-4